MWRALATSVRGGPARSITAVGGVVAAAGVRRVVATSVRHLATKGKTRTTAAAARAPSQPAQQPQAAATADTSAPVALATATSVKSEQERIEAAQTALNELGSLLRPGGGGAPPQRVIDVVRSCGQRHAFTVQLTNEVFAPLCSASIAGPAALSFLLCGGRFTPRHLSQLTEYAEVTRNGPLALKLYEQLVRPTLSLGPVPAFSEAAVGGRARRSPGLNSAARAKPVAATAQWPVPSVDVLSALSTSIRALLALRQREHALVVYDDIWRAVERHNFFQPGAAQSDFRFSSLPVESLMKLMASNAQHQSIVHLYATLKLEWFMSLQSWFAEAHREARPTKPPTFTVANDSIFSIVLTAVFETSQFNQRRMLEYLVQVTQEQNEIMRMLVAQPALKRDDGSAPESSSPPTPAPATSVHSVDQLLSLHKASASSAEGELEGEQSELEPSGDSVPRALPPVVENRKYKLLSIAVRYVIADWLRHYSQTLVKPLRFPDRLVGESQAGRLLAAALSPLTFSQPLHGALTRPMLQQVVDGFLRFNPGARLSLRWVRTLYNRSIHSFAEPLQTEFQAELDEQAEANSDITLRPVQLELDSVTWKLCFVSLLRFTSSYSHSLAVMMASQAHAPAVVHSPFVLLRHMLASKFAHSYAHVLSLYPPAQLKYLTASQLPGTELAWRDWHTFWRHIELLRAETAAEAADLIVGSRFDQELPGVARAALDVYTRLEQQYIAAATQEGLLRGHIQLIQGSTTTSDAALGARDVFVIHLPSTLFPTISPTDRLAQADLHDHLNFCMRALQHLITSGQVLGDSLSIAVVASWRDVGQNAAFFNGVGTGKFSIKADAQTKALSEHLYAASPLHALKWRDNVLEQTERALAELFRMKAIAAPVPSALATQLRAPQGHATTAYVTLAIDAKRVARWIGHSFVSFHLPAALLPPNASPIASYTWKQPNKAALGPPTPTTLHSTTPIATMSATAVATGPPVKDQPLYASRSYYLRAASQFVTSRDNRSPFFDARMDLRSQEQEWTDILRMLKDQGEDKSHASTPAS